MKSRFPAPHYRIQQYTLAENRIAVQLGGGGKISTAKVSPPGLVAKPYHKQTAWLWILSLHVHTPGWVVLDDNRVCALWNEHLK
jgi:hypothetical protein